MLVICPRMMAGKEKTGKKTKHAGVDAGLDVMEGWPWKGR